MQLAGRIGIAARDINLDAAQLLFCYLVKRKMSRVNDTESHTLFSTRTTFLKIIYHDKQTVF